MAKYPIKVLLDKYKKPFIPFITSDAVVVNNSDKTLADLFNERYTKEEVDNIIKSLGTLQRLCGKVNSVEELPKDANPGDTYVVVGVSGNNSEYMFIGDAWEELGPMIDLSIYDTSAVIDGKLVKLSDELKQDSTDKVAESLRQAKQYTDNSLGNIQSTAANTSYDNATSGLQATNVQGAIDILQQSINGVERELDAIIQGV